MEKVYEKAIKLLKIRPHHSEELRRKLSMRGFNRGEIDATIEKLQEEKLLDNDAFIQLYLDELLRNKTYGYYQLKSKLLARGIASNDADKFLKQSLSLETEKEIAVKVLERNPGLEKNKLAQKLSRKGFRSEVITVVISLPAAGR
jgi:regulatory protein